MALGLNTSRLVRVSVNFSPVASARRGFGTLLLVGDTNEIDGVERFRSYTSLEAVLEDFSVTDPEYLSALLYYGQTPKPENLMIGRWLQSATAGLNVGGIIPIADQSALLATLVAIADGSFDIDIDSVTENITGANFTGETTLSGCASVLTALLETASTGSVCSWDGSKFVIISGTTGVTSLVGYASTGGAGTDISGSLRLTSALTLRLVAGFASETPLEAVTALAMASGAWYGITFASTNLPSDTDITDIAGYIEGATPARVFGVTNTNANTLEASYETDIAFKLEALGYNRTITTYASSNEFAISSMFGRAFSVNFEANRSTITLMYKQMIGIVAENVTDSQADALEAKKCNLFVKYSNDTAIFQTGVMASGAFFDEIHGLDWFADALQNAEYNLLYTSKTKIPQTDAGANQIVDIANSVCLEAVNNGLVAGGQWNADGFGQLERGDGLPSGFYVYMQPMAEQDQSSREQRLAPPMQIALKLAGAIHEIDVIVDVNR